jgi:hypothetical protein
MFAFLLYLQIFIWNKNYVNKGIGNLHLPRKWLCYLNFSSSLQKQVLFYLNFCRRLTSFPLKWVQVNICYYIIFTSLQNNCTTWTFECIFSFGFSLPSISMGSPQPFHTKPDTEGLYLFACGEVDGLTASLPTLGAQSTPNKWDPLPSGRAWVILHTFVGVHRSLGCLWYMTCGPSNPWEMGASRPEKAQHSSKGWEQFRSVFPHIH